MLFRLLKPHLTVLTLTVYKSFFLMTFPFPYKPVGHFLCDVPSSGLILF